MGGWWWGVVVGGDGGEEIVTDPEGPFGSALFAEGFPPVLCS